MSYSSTNSESLLAVGLLFDLHGINDQTIIGFEL